MDLNRVHSKAARRTNYCSAHSSCRHRRCGQRRWKRAGWILYSSTPKHIALDRAQVSWMCQTYSRMGLPPLVRIPSPDPFAGNDGVGRSAAGIVAPYIETAEQAQALRGAVKFARSKVSGWPSGSPVNRSKPELEGYISPPQHQRAGREHRERAGR